MVLNRISEYVDVTLIPEQAGFRPGKSCCGQVLNLTQYIEDGFEKEMITGVVFIDLTAAYDTINHKRLSQNIPGHKRLSSYKILRLYSPK